MKSSRSANSFGRELKERFTAPGAVRSRVERQIADLENCRPLLRRPPRQRAQSSEELVKGKGLGEIVVRARVEPGHSIFDRVACREHENRAPDTFAAQASTDLEAVEAVREHDVEDDHVVGSGLGHPECFCSASGDVGGVPLFT